jgi:SAM-dependent methyltransferase
MRSVSPTLPPGFENLRVGYGAAFADLDQNSIEGFILCLDQELDSVQIYNEGILAGAAPLQDSPDIADLFPTIAHASRSNYQLRPPPAIWKTDTINRTLVVGFHGRKPITRISSIFFADTIRPDVPIPTSDLVQLVQGTPDPITYKGQGFRYYHQIREAVARHQDWRSLRRVLDWACGSGRLASYFLAEPDAPTVRGCDVHAGAIAWCRANLPNGEFRLVEGSPDLPYPDAGFDLAIALAAVMPFGPKEMALLFDEMKRVLAPGGLLVMSLQGLFAAAIRFPPKVIADMVQDGFVNGSRHDALHPPAPEYGKFYRGGFYWTPDFVAREWTKFFDILEYDEGMLNYDQDLVVMRRRN